MGKNKYRWDNAVADAFASLEKVMDDFFESYPEDENKSDPDWRRVATAYDAVDEAWDDLQEAMGPWDQFEADITRDD